MNRSTASQKYLEARKYLENAIFLARLEISKRYKKSFLGIWWSLVTPIITIAIYYIIFESVLRSPNSSKLEYFTYIVSGVIYITFIVQTLTMVAENLSEKASVLHKINARPNLLGSSVAIASLLNFLISLSLLFTILIASGIGISLFTLLIFPFAVYLMLIMLSFGLLFSIVYVYFEDAKALVRIAIGFIPYLTPVFYRTSDLPASVGELINVLPTTQLLIVFRFLLRINTDSPTSFSILTLLILAAIIPINFLIFDRLWKRAIKLI